MNVPSRSTTLLLVHGAWHGPAVFDALRRELSALGYPSSTVKLPTSGPDPRGGLRDDAGAVRDAITAIDGPLAVVAHSYGGVPVTEAAALPGVEHLVYLAAYQLDRGESVGSFHGMPEPADTSGLSPIIADPRTSLYADVPDDAAGLAVSRLVEQRTQSFTDRVGEPAWHTIPSTYILCEQDQALPASEQERMAVRAKSVRRLATSHSPFLSRPAELAALLAEIVTPASDSLPDRSEGSTC
ncbi:alpha/beta hydrolase [Actinoplanes sp. M2I2]|uniref:alpha/beta hydrolase n=1 Tax=Actinoplanes sp. M2I2 TaxID=1734444 RepID=UPI002021B053|nr:alpha/beta hydrolase [Actinoplanes sp. M2I2]